MTKLGKYLMLGAFFCLAVLCLFVGSVIGAIAFIALGVLLELAMWVGIFKSRVKTASQSKSL
jgi:hypothetical protein